MAGLLGGFVAAPMVVAATWSLDLAGGFAAVGLIDILLGVLGLMLSTLTAIAGALVVADVRADVDAARAWQGIKVEVTAVGKPADTAPAGPFDAHYVVGQQDEGLRRILLAHRFDVPLPALKDTALSAPASAGATGSAGLAGTCVDKKPTTARELMAAVTPLDAMASPERNLSDRAPRLIASKPNRQEHSIDVRGMRQRDMRCAMRATTKMRLVANAGRSSKWTEHSTVASHGGPASGFAAEVIFLAADRNVSDRGLNALVSPPLHRRVSR